MVYRRGRYIQVDDRSFFHKVPPNKAKMLHFQIVELVLLPSTKIQGLTFSEDCDGELKYGVRIINENI